MKRALGLSAGPLRAVGVDDEARVGAFRGAPLLAHVLQHPVVDRSLGRDGRDLQRQVGGRGSAGRESEYGGD